VVYASGPGVRAAVKCASPEGALRVDTGIGSSGRPEKGNRVIQKGAVLQPIRRRDFEGPLPGEGLLGKNGLAIEESMYYLLLLAPKWWNW
jgi:hypothetical protein